MALLIHENEQAAASDDRGALEQQPGFLTSVLDSFNSHVAVVNAEGIIIAVNRAWQEFAEHNGLGVDGYCIGENYLTVCRTATGAYSREAPLVAEALGEVLAGIRAEFRQEYPCHSPDERRWFQLRITSLEFNGHRYALLAHENITSVRIRSDDFERSSQVYQNALRNLNDGLLFLEATTGNDAKNSDFRISDSNDAVGGLLGVALPRKQQLLSASLPPFIADRLLDRAREVVRTQQTIEEEFEIAHPSLAARWLRTSAIPREGGVLIILRDTTIEKQLEKEIESSERRLAQFSENVPGMIYQFTIDPNGNAAFPFVSRGSMQLFGLAAEAIQEDASTILSLIHPADRAEFDRAIARSMKDLIRFEWEGRCILPNNCTLWLKAASHPERLPHGVTSWSGLLMDITVIKDAAERAEELLTMKRQFLASMSHELRTPLTGIIGMAQLVAESAVDQDQDELLQSIRETANSMLSVVNNILDFSRLEKNKVELQLRPFSIPNLLRSISGMFRHQSRERTIEFDLQYDQRIPEWVLGDSDRIKQVLVNLLHNAYKFSTSRSSVQLLVDLLPSGGETVNVRFSVQDFGSGIAPADLKNLFVPFVQGEAGKEERHGGTGLGLAISSNLVELMKGALEVESTLGKGSRFYFTIPLTPMEREAAVPAGEEAKPKRLVRSLNILLAEDNTINEIIAVRLLERHGHKVTVARDGAEAISRCEKEDFELILMDMEMPKVNGIEATAAIRRLHRNASVPVIALTAHALPGNREQFLAQGLDGYLIKPLIAEELYALIERLSMQ